MINRRYLRIKVYQSLYALWQGDDTSAARIEKELLNSIERTLDLYVALMDILVEVHRVALERIEERRNKHLPTAEDLAPNRRFVDGPVITAFANSARLQTEVGRRKAGWVGHREMIVRITRQFEQSEPYKAYMTEEEHSFRKDQDIVLDLFVEHIANFEGLHDLLEGRSIYWLEDLDLACSMVKRTIEGVRAGDTEPPFQEMGPLGEEEQEFVRTLFKRTIALHEEHEKAIAARASNWESDRIALSDMILMQMALTEARVFDQIPVKVTLNEYIEIAKAYSTPKSKNFINGILDKLFIEMRENGTIRKVGRGLLEN